MESPVIDVKVAIKTARDYFQSLFPDKAKGSELEEVDLSPDKKFWLITLSFPKPDLNIFGQPLPNPRREYKEIVVDAVNGAPLAAKIKVPAGV
jgi:hypothetical protein